MSQRALRKAQKQKELLQSQQQHEEVAEPDEDGDEEWRHDLPAQKPSQRGAFDILANANMDGAADENSNEQEEEEEEEEEEVERNKHHEPEDALTTNKGDAPETDSKKKKKKKKKKKASNKTQAQEAAASGMDEIEQALNSLTASDNRTGDASAHQIPKPADPATLEVCKLLSIDMQHLHVANEMRRLFGRAAVEADREADQEENSRRRRGTREGLGLAEAVAGRNARNGAGLPAVLRRRNIFSQGKEDWPRATGGGLTMELVERRAGDIVEYRFVHKREYQDSQHEFSACVEAMDPSLMVNMLQFIPYHVATLLQVSEIAKHEKDYATAGELLERALFSFGRAVHPTFSADLAAGKARLDFRRPENREFWMAVWLYIGNISMRATWRTAYEWARLLLSLDPEKDPYCISLLIDQLALRARQAQSFLDISRSKFFAKRWSRMTNIVFSQAIALQQIGGDKSRAEDELVKAIEKFPWVGARLFKELDIPNMPKAIWGLTATSQVDILHCELYTSQAKDLWKLPETISLLVNAANKATDRREPLAHAINTRAITLDEARHVLLTDKASLIGLLPHSITCKIDSASDPLRPDDELLSYSTGATEDYNPSNIVGAAAEDFIHELSELQHYFQTVLPNYERPNEDGATDNGTRYNSAEIANAIRRTGTSLTDASRHLSRLRRLREMLGAQPGRRVVSVNGDEAVMMESGETITRIGANRSSTSNAGLVNDGTDDDEVNDDNDDDDADAAP